MDIAQILERLRTDNGLPVEALRAAHIHRAAMVPLFLKGFEQSATADEATQAMLFFAFHLLGEWRETSAYRPLTTFLRRPSAEIGPILGHATTETSHRVLAAVFDGDPKPLYEVILDPDADEFLRARMCDAIAILNMRQEMSREEVLRFFRMCYSELQPQDDCFVWDGWQGAIAKLGLAELKPLVAEVFKRGFIDPTSLSFADFEQDLQSALDDGPSSLRHVKDEYELFGDTIEELSDWAAFNQKREKKRQPSGAANWGDSGWPMTPVTNPFRNVGRNDPCPCGSGRKFKKCCLGKAELKPEVAEPRNWHDLDAVTHEESGEFAEYDPLVEPAPVDWLALSEQDRIDLIEDYHRRAGVRPPAAEMHAIIHLIVENQIAEGDALPVRRNAQRLMSEGLDRHDAIHAIGSVLVGYVNDLMREARVGVQPGERRSSRNSNDAYFAELESLTAEAWRQLA